MMVDEEIFFEAVRYTLQEMSPPERDAFERLLADDQHARESLAFAVKLFEMTAGAFDELSQNTADGRPREYFDRSLAEVNPQVAADHRWRRPSTWAAMALAASVLTAVIVLGVKRDRSLPSFTSARADADRQLAVAWAKSPALSEVSDAGEVVDDADVADDADSVDTQFENIDAGGNDAPPFDIVPTDRTDWLLEALTASRRHERFFPTHAATRGEG